MVTTKKQLEAAVEILTTALTQYAQDDSWAHLCNDEYCLHYKTDYIGGTDYSNGGYEAQQAILATASLLGFKCASEEWY